VISLGKDRKNSSGKGNESKEKRTGNRRGLLQLSLNARLNDLAQGRRTAELGSIGAWSLRRRGRKVYAEGRKAVNSRPKEYGLSNCDTRIDAGKTIEKVLKEKLR